MAARIRVYELARELGLTNKETLDLCEALGIGVKSHSSSIEDAQADRVRRKAEREGLKRDVQPEEPEPPKKAAAKKKAAPAAEAPGDGGERAAAAASAKLASEAGGPAPATESPPRPPMPSRAPIRSTPTAPPQPATPVAPAAAARSTERVGASDQPPAPSAAAPSAAAPTAPRPQAPAAAPSAERVGASEASGARDQAPDGASGDGPAPPPAPGRLHSPSGKPIPPPPGVPRSASGRPIPPPPGSGRPAPAPGGPRPSGGGPRPSGGPPGGGGGGGFGGGGRPSGGRPSGGFAPGGRPGGGQFPRSQVPGAGAGRGGPPGRGGPGQGRPRPQRPRRRRRRVFEELEPTQAPTYTPTDAPIPEGEIVIERGSTAQDLGPKLNRTAADVVRFLLEHGEMVTATQSLTDDMVELFSEEIGAAVRIVDPGQEQEVELQSLLDEDELEDEQALRPRPPIITVMGHVDHGKTLLLDRIRETNVVAGEAGGITQHIGAYQVERDGQLVTFIDTPGHEAFTAMRARGADVTDIAVLVVAADDGVMPQTVEALNHAKAAEVPIVVAINKIDRDNADVNRVKQQLTEQELVPEDWGGDTITVPISALQNEGIDALLEQLLLVAEVEELRANPEGRARGTVLEANLDVGRGPVATVLVESGTLRVGDPIVAGAAWGRVRALIDDKGDNIKEAAPSAPVQVLGLSEVPFAGDEFRIAPDDKTARTVAEAREQRYRFAGLAAATPVVGTGARLEDIFEQIQRGEIARLNLILKADVHGSLEALTGSLKKLERDEVKLSFVDRGVGGITKNDVQLATASSATIIGFNVRPDRGARELAETQGVEIRTYEIIYQVLEDIEAAMVGMLKPEYEEVVTGEAEVREVFRVPRVGAVAGCYVRNGVITRGSKVRFLREGVVIWHGTVSSLKRFKEDAREVATGFECGIGLSDFQDLKQGDIIETYEEREIPRA